MREQWGSRLGFILAALGSAIGLGTLWKFPYITGRHGGGLFVLLYFLFTLLLGIPLFIAELIIGRRSHRSAVGSFITLSGPSTPWRLAGWLGVLSSFFILSYYCVVGGWGLNYFLLSLNQFYIGRTPQAIASTFDILFQAGDITLFWSLLFLGFTVGIVLPGIQKGIEKWSRILTILLLLLLVMLAAYACTLPGFKDALRFLFHFDLSELRWEGVLEALGLSLFTLSLAQGVIITYGSYVQPEEDLPKIAWIIGISVGVISLLTVLTIFPVIFTFHLPPEEGTGLVFKTLPVLFTELPGSMVLSTLFFALFTFTGLTSAVSLLEVSAAHLIDLYQWGRKKAVFCAALAACIVGIPSALAGSHTLFKSWSSLYGSDFFTTLDQLISNWFLPIGALLISLYIGWHMKKEAVRDEFLRGSTMPSYFSIWYALIRWLAPLAISLILLQKGSVH